MRCSCTAFVSAGGRSLMVGLAVMLALGLMTGCSGDHDTTQIPSPTPDDVATSAAPSATPSTTPTLKPTAEPSAPSTPASAAPAPSAAPIETVTVTQTVAPSSPARQPVRKATLGMGETAHLANWDVTVLRGEHGKDGISYGWKVDVCYVAHSEFEENGRIAVSDRPWSAIIQDLEGGEENPVVTVPIREFERDHAYRPDYVDTTLALGECSLGWIGIVHGNPDLGWFGIVYQPSTGENITWRN